MYPALTEGPLLGPLLTAHFLPEVPVRQRPAPPTWPSISCLQVRTQYAPDGGLWLWRHSRRHSPSSRSRCAPGAGTHSWQWHPSARFRGLFRRGQWGAEHTV